MTNSSPKPGRLLGRGTSGRSASEHCRDVQPDGGGFSASVRSERSGPASLVRVKVLGIARVGVAIDRVETLLPFFRDVLGLRVDIERPHFAKPLNGDGDIVELFGPHFRAPDGSVYDLCFDPARQPS